MCCVALGCTALNYVMCVFVVGRVACEVLWVQGPIERGASQMLCSGGGPKLHPGHRRLVYCVDTSSVLSGHI